MSCKVDVGTVERVNVTLTSSFRWKIEDFSLVNADPGWSMLSPVFTTADCSVKWHLKLYPNGKNEEESEYLSMSVYYCSEIETDASYELSIVNAQDRVLEFSTMRKDLSLVADFESLSEAWIPYRFHPKIVQRSFIEDPSNFILMDDCLTISFEITLQNPIIPNPNYNNVENLRDDRLKEFNDFGKLLDNGQYSDVTFIVGDQKIRAHKAILAARNAVFRKVFSHNVQNDDGKTVLEINDLKYPVLKELLRFMYVGIVNDVYNMADDLLAAADEYCCKGLKMYCEKTLCGYLDVHNVIQLFVMADTREAKILKEKALKFIAEHADEIVERDEFTSLSPDMMREIVRAMAKKKVVIESH